MKFSVALLRKVVKGDLPFRALFYSLGNRIAHALVPSRRRYVFEMLYAENADPWNYAASRYERDKYAATLERIIRYRRGSRTALELGCSIGEFSALLADRFEKITCLDFSAEALRRAVSLNRNLNNAQFLRCAIQDLSLGQTYDVIICAEVLYYLDRRYVDDVCRRLGAHLGADGILITVAGLSDGDRSPDSVNWEEELSTRFQVILDEVSNSDDRPYRTCIFSHRQP